MPSMGGLWSADPVVATNQDGRLELFAVGVDGRMYRRHQAAPNQDFVAGFRAMPNNLHVDPFYNERVVFDPLTARPSVVRAGGKLWVFARTTRGRIAYIRQEPSSATGWLTDWKSLGAAQDDHPLVGNPIAAAGSQAGDNIMVFVRNTDGALLVKEQRSLDDWNDWRQWPAGGVLASDPAILRHSFSELSSGDLVSKLLLVARGLNTHPWVAGQVVRQHGNLASAHDVSWTDVGAGGPVGSALGGAPVVHGEGVIWRGLDGGIYERRQGPNPWDFAPEVRRVAAGAGDDPTSVSGEIYFVSPSASLMRVARGTTSAILEDAAGRPAAALSQNGRIEVFFRRSDAAIHHMFQMTVGGALQY